MVDLEQIEQRASKLPKDCPERATIQQYIQASRARRKQHVRIRLAGLHVEDSPLRIETAHAH